jgi:phosphoenolpyruvate carboxylase
MFARSDSAMSYGMMASVLSVLIAIDKALKWGELNKVELAPILGCGALPFRGHFTAENLDHIYETYAGVKTFTIQSALRYDHGPEKIKAVVNSLKNNSEKPGRRNFAPDDLALMKECIGIFTKYYMDTFVKTIDIVGLLSKYMPKNRDRLASTKTGLEYIREIANMQEIVDLVEDPELKKELLEINTNVKCSVPRAISFTAALYTLGLPPEFIGVGRGLQEVQRKFGEEAITKLIDCYPQLRADLSFASQYVNVKIAKGIIDEEARVAYQEDYNLACEILEINCGGNDKSENALYHMLLKSIRPIILHLIEKEDPGKDQEEEKILNDWIIKMATIRGSLG